MARYIDPGGLSAVSPGSLMSILRPWGNTSNRKHILGFWNRDVAKTLPPNSALAPAVFVASRSRSSSTTGRCLAVRRLKKACKLKHSYSRCPSHTAASRSIFLTKHGGFVKKQFPENWAEPHLLVKATPQLRGAQTNPSVDSESLKDHDSDESDVAVASTDHALGTPSCPNHKKHTGVLHHPRSSQIRHCPDRGGLGPWSSKWPSHCDLPTVEPNPHTHHTQTESATHSTNPSSNRIIKKYYINATNEITRGLPTGYWVFRTVWWCPWWRWCRYTFHDKCSIDPPHRTFWRRSRRRHYWPRIALPSWAERQPQSMLVQLALFQALYLSRQAAPRSHICTRLLIQLRLHTWPPYRQPLRTRWCRSFQQVDTAPIRQWDTRLHQHPASRNSCWYMISNLLNSCVIKVRLLRGRSS